MDNYFCKSCTPWDKKNWGNAILPTYYTENKKLMDFNKFNVILEEKDKDFITSNVFYEKIPKSLLISLINSGKIKEIQNYSITDLFYMGLYDGNKKIKNKMDHLLAYNKRNIKDYVPIVFKKLLDGCWGRPFAVNGLSINCFDGYIRRSILRDDYYDFDISSSYIGILKNTCDKLGMVCPAIKYMFENKEEVRNGIMKHYGIKNDTKGIYVCKDIIYINIYNGDKEDLKWMYENYKLDSKKKLPDILVKMKEEVSKIKKELIRLNPVLWGYCRRTFPKVNGRVFFESKNTLGRDNLEGYFISLYLQEQEFRLVSGILEWLFYYTNVLRSDGQNGCFIYEFDGFHLLKERVVDEFGNVDNLVRMMNEKTKEVFDLDLKWGVKSMDEDYYDIGKFLQIDPALYNVLNGCWLCNYDKQNLENDYLMDRSFFNGVEGPPCNKPFIMIPKNSKD